MNDMAATFKFDSATAISKGARELQEDAIIADFSNGADASIAVLADGMGGHAAGDLASKIVVTEVFSELTFRRQEFCDTPATLPETLRKAVIVANDSLATYVDENPQTRGMGATLLSTIIVADALFWVSVGDSPLYLFRDNDLQQLNEDHSLGPHIDMLVRTGVMSFEEGQDHPERNALTSALLGRKIALIDCPEEPMQLRPGDTLIMASDGLQFLADEQIAETLRQLPFSRSAEIADNLMRQLDGLGDPDLDNVTMSIIQIQNAPPKEKPLVVDEPAKTQDRPRFRFRRSTPETAGAPAE